MTISTLKNLYRCLLYLSLLVILGLACMDPGELVIFSVSDKLLHGFAFLVLSALLDCSYPGIVFSSIKIMLLLAYGLFIEIVQYQLPWREASALDMVANSVGIVIWYFFQQPGRKFLLEKIPEISSGAIHENS